MTNANRKRYFVPPFFGFWDTRPRSLDEVQDHWEENIKKQHRDNQASIFASIRQEYGSDRFEHKLENFKDFGYVPMSIVSYHNLFFHQVRRAFIVESYYPALTGACALGERILNHLILDLRNSHTSKPNYKLVHRKRSFDNWKAAITALDDWAVFEPGIAAKFAELERIRNRSLHFSPETASKTRQDALSSALLIKQIIEGQFSSFGSQRWFIRGTKGACFLKREAESDPFVRNFYLPQCPLVGYRYAIDFLPNGAALVFDSESYAGDEVDDDEFARLHNERAVDELVSTIMPPDPGVITWLLTTGKAEQVTLIRALPSAAT
ncbi:hypothetical protein [Tardiphaga sp. 42S5]|uniref:hypothetical protein n=1 Tax=Tardiphaga sp. 42S5 TaxID=1404799 RepID=UPI002A59AD4F|nr:hypothetical protein [Tardiphaga sp. 42S5]WPO40615.1 hypothetical protein SFY93_24260 [Tardiphaga sp. 42S5]